MLELIFQRSIKRESKTENKANEAGYFFTVLEEITTNCRATSG
jgi:hypothetical protein